MWNLHRCTNATFALQKRLIMKSSSSGRCRSQSGCCLIRLLASLTNWSPEFLRDVARISVFKNGPALVREFLDQHGIVMIVEPALSPWLDGAAMMCRNIPVIALTLRHDRLDNFWFVVMHELVHLFKHLESESASFYDDLDSDSQADPQEIEADTLATEILIPTDVWRTSPASRLRSPDAANHLAQRLRIHPAIVAGRIRFLRPTKTTAFCLVS